MIKWGFQNDLSLLKDKDSLFLHFSISGTSPPLCSFYVYASGFLFYFLFFLIVNRNKCTEP